ncbi:MAG: PAS domain S-box protein [Flavobacteriales bacterium]|nr:PAS domain S-box protein [Flavobacteriales bacterium]MBK6944334.1 PAS domain S-box protein [Flavobacteriales bacterium]MBK7242122.1 PAS domain S-box protein [Flavobacteriales bacterium]MBK9534001.1 PAS domain S-box protein [Flavobacteriales bacterium]MBP9137531.1 PAS domain S-box protein [Flavobacteriales bacterium]
MRTEPKNSGPDLDHAHGPEKELKELRQQFNDVVDRNLAGVFRTTVQGRILICNDALAHMLGYANKQELVDHSVLDLYYSSADRDRYLERLKSEKKLINFEILLKHKNGKPIHVLENVYLDEHAGEAGIIDGSLIDITRYKQAELEQHALINSFRSLVEHIRDGILLIVEGAVNYANPAADELLGGQLIGTRAIDLVKKHDRAKFEQLLELAEEKGSAGPVQIGLTSAPEAAIMLFAARTTHEGIGAVQLTIQDQSSQQELIKERMRVHVAEEVNQVLRQEITEHRRTQDALRLSKRFARSLVDSSLDMILAADQEGLITEYNPAAAMRFGWEAEEVMGTNSRKLYADESQFLAVQKEMNDHGVFAGEIRNMTKYGEVFTSYLAASRLFDEDGKNLGAMGVSRDITHLKRDQEALKASEEKYRDLFENATDLIQSVDAEGKFEYVNAAWRKALGYTDEELKDLRILDIIEPMQRERYAAVRVRVMQGEQKDRIDTVFVAKSGERIHVEGTSNARYVNGEPVATRSIFHDVTTMYAAKEKVREHEAKLKALFESSEHLFWTVDPDIKLTSFNRGYQMMVHRLYGVDPEINLDQNSPRKLFADPEYHVFWNEQYAKAFGGTPVRFETDRSDLNGERICNEIFLSPVFGDNGKVKEVFGVGHEITDKKEAEELVRDQAARLKAIFENAANVMIWTLDTEFCITSYNEHFRENTEQHMGLLLAKGDDFVSLMRNKLAEGKDGPTTAKYSSARKGIPQQFEAELKNKYGRSLWVETFLNPIITDGKVTEISCIGYGITDRKESQLKLMQSLGEKEVLLQEVHHRVKNNLQIISSILSLQSAHVGNDERILELLRDSRDRIRSMSFIHESLYQTKDFSSIDLANYIDGLSSNLMMSYSLNGKIALHKDLKSTNLVLDQAIPCGLILNELISNALKHAFPDEREGEVRIKLENTEEQVRITISDNGIGVKQGFDAELDGNLGLELVHTLAEQLDGKIQLVIGEGVTYLLTFDRHK